MLILFLRLYSSLIVFDSQLSYSDDTKENIHEVISDISIIELSICDEDFNQGCSIYPNIKWSVWKIAKHGL